MEVENSNFKNKYKIRSTIINIDGNIKANEELIFKIFSTSDIRKKDLVINKKQAILFYLTGLVDEQKVNSIVNEISAISDNLEMFMSNHTLKSNKVVDIEKAILAGNSILFLENESSAFIFSTENSMQRTFSPPTIDNSLKGTKISFVETYQTNIALLRRFITTSSFRTHQTEIGTDNKRTVSLAYIDGVVDEELLNLILEKISEIKEDAIFNVNQLAQLIERNPISPFPQLLTTERPDEAASALLKGRVVLILDRSAEVVVLPSNFLSFFQSIDDYSSRTLIGSFNRILRVVAFFITLFLPGLYIAIISFNYEIVPLKLLISIGESRTRVPFDPLVEAIIMEITLEMLREAGIRLPAPISTTVGVVGGIVIGQAAVQAAIVSNIMVIVVALTAISSFIIPNFEMASSLRIIRFPIMLMASLFGLIGLVVSTMVLIVHGLTLTNFKTSYTVPFSPVKFSQLNDTFIRMPLKYLWNKHKKRNR